MISREEKNPDRKKALANNTMENVIERLQMLEQNMQDLQFELKQTLFILTRNQRDDR